MSGDPFDRDQSGARPTVLRADDDSTSNDKQLRGHMIVFNRKSVDMGFYEIVKPVAADRMMAERPDILALWSHDSSIPLGRSSAGTVRYEKVTRGVAIQIDPPSWAHGHVETVARGDVKGMSFGFFVLDDSWHLEDGYPVRELLDMHVIEGSPVAFPAYESTDLRVVNSSARSAWEIERSTKERLRLAR